MVKYIIIGDRDYGKESNQFGTVKYLSQKHES